MKQQFPIMTKRKNSEKMNDIEFFSYLLLKIVGKRIWTMEGEIKGKSLKNALETSDVKCIGIFFLTL